MAKKWTWAVIGGATLWGSFYLFYYLGGTGHEWWNVPLVVTSAIILFGSLFGCGVLRG